MRPRIPISPEQIVAALNGADGDIPAAAKALGVSERTLYRRIAEIGLRIRYEQAAGAA